MSELKEFLEMSGCCHQGGGVNREESFEEMQKALENQDYHLVRHLKVMVENPEWFRNVERLVNQNDYQLSYLRADLPKIVGTLKDIIRTGANPDYQFLIDALKVRARDIYDEAECEALLLEAKDFKMTEEEVERVKGYITVFGLERTLVRLTNNSFDALNDFIHQFNVEKSRIVPDIERLTEIVEDARARVEIAKEIRGILSNNKNDGNNYGDE